jgi:hypothetical protein
MRSLAGTFALTNGAVGGNPNGAQCVNVPNDLWDSLGGQSLYGNAADWVGVRRRWLGWLPMTLDLRVRAGDTLVIPASGNTPDGHVAVVLDGSKDPFLTLSQNYPTGTDCQLRRFDRSVAVGVLRYVG